MNSNLRITSVGSQYKYQRKENQNSSPSFTHNSSANNLSTGKKAVILTTSALGIVPVMAVLAKQKAFSLNPSKILKTPVKDWAIFKFRPKETSIKFEEPQIIAVATGSVAGGFVGGAIVDKSNIKAKKREALNQILGNVLIPVGCVGSGSRIYEKYADKIQGIMPQIKGDKKIIKILNKCLKNLPNAALTVGLLGVGIYLGNRVSNFINERIYNKKVDRNIKASDFAPHVDDLCMATSMMNKESEFGSKLARVIPVALLVPGYQTGIAQEH